ncbi:hypothetical protein Pelo_19519 [Pelomyxa schiedti]|nr:hypothetical protein Pelo_19519 [Pelomyxa schiedti]
MTNIVPRSQDSVREPITEVVEAACRKELHLQPQNNYCPVTADPVTQAVFICWLSTYISAKKLPEVLAAAYAYCCITGQPVDVKALPSHTDIPRIIGALNELDQQHLTRGLHLSSLDG